MVLALSSAETENEPKLIGQCVKCYDRGLLRALRQHPSRAVKSRELKTYVLTNVHNRITHDNQKVEINVHQPIDG